MLAVMVARVIHSAARKDFVRANENSRLITDWSLVQAQVPPPEQEKMPNGCFFMTLSSRKLSAADWHLEYLTSPTKTTYLTAQGLPGFLQ